MGQREGTYSACVFRPVMKRRKNGISYFHLFFDQLERPNDITFMYVHVS